MRSPRLARHDLKISRLMAGTSHVCYIDVPTEAEVLAASAAEAGAQVAHAEHAAGDALEAAADAEAAAQAARDAGEQMASVNLLTLELVGQSMTEMRLELEDIKARLANVGTTANVALDQADTALEVAVEVAEEIAPPVDEEVILADPAPDTGLTVATAEEVMQEPPQVRKKKFFRL